MDNGAFVWTVNYQTSGSVRGGEALLLPATNGVEGMSPLTTDSHGDTVHWTGGSGGRWEGERLLGGGGLARAAVLSRAVQGARDVLGRWA